MNSYILNEKLCTNFLNFLCDPCIDAVIQTKAQIMKRERESGKIVEILLCIQTSVFVLGTLLELNFYILQIANFVSFS